MRSATVARLGLILLLLAAAAPASRAGDDPDAFAEMDDYNRGVALYRDERFEESAEAFRKAVAATDPVLAARARFNLGNADYARALNSFESQDPGAVPAAIELVRNAIESYRSALRLAPQDDDARFNLELASKLMRQLEQQQEQEQQEQEEETKEQKQPEGEKGEQEKPKEGNQQDQGGEPPPEQPSPSEKNEQPGENQDGEGEDGEGDNQDSTDDQQASEGAQKSDEPQDQSGGSGSESEEESSSKPESSGERSDDAKETNDQSPGESSDPQPTPEGELTAAGGSESSQQPADESSESSGEALRMTQEEARKLLQTIRDRDMLRRLRRQAAQRARQIPVARDW